MKRGDRRHWPRLIGVAAWSDAAIFIPSPNACMIELMIVVALVVLTSAMCSLFEAVLYSVPISQIENLVSAKHRSGVILRDLRENVNEPITAILSLNTLANTSGAAVSGAIAVDVLGPGSVVHFSIVFTFMILILSEIIPKTAGVVYSRRLAVIIARPLKWMVWVFRPMIWFCGKITRIVSGAGGREPAQVSEEELLTLTRLSMRSGAIDNDEARVIHNILSLEDKTVHRVMTPRTVLFGLDCNITVDEARKAKGILLHSRIPVYQRHFEDVVGIVHRHDILAEAADDKLDTTLKALMKPVDFVLESSRLNIVLKKFLDHGKHLFVVLGEFGGLAGVVTLEDVLEEILGQEIVDEFDQVTDMQQLARTRKESVLKEAGYIPHEAPE